MRPTIAEILLGPLRENLETVRGRAGCNCRVIAVVKADAYGHGAAHVAAELFRQGVDRFAVASLEEALDVLPNIDPARADILILGPVRGEELDEVAARGFVPVISSLSDLRVMSEWHQRARYNGRMRVILDIDTGMGRMGVLPEEVPEALEKIRREAWLNLVGVFSHFPVADSVEPEDQEFTRRQIENLTMLAKGARAAFPEIELVSIANTGGLFFHEGALFNAVRPGISLYGVSPSVSTPPHPDLAPVMRWVTRVDQVRRLPAGSSVSYGRQTILARDSKLALLPVGYADGLKRRISPGFQLIVRGKRAPIAGVITMDLTLLDVTDVPGVEPGDRVLILGHDTQPDADGLMKKVELRAEEHARATGCIPYEILTAVGRRVKRVCVGKTSSE